MKNRVMNVQPPDAIVVGWSDLLSGGNLIRSLALSGGVALHAINLYISTTILPSAVREIGGLDYYAWNTTLFVVASILGAALSSRVLGLAGPKAGYAYAALVFVLGTLGCALAPTMEVMLAGRFVQGLGGGLLLALPYAMIRRVFPEPLWPRALALLSSMWGIATLLGPAVGGIFAEYGVWRGAFWALIPAAAIVTIAALFVLPARNAEQDDELPIPATQLVLLLAAVIAASFGSVGASVSWTVGGLSLAFGLVGILVFIEMRSPRRMFPRGVFSLSSPLGMLYLISALLAVTVTCTEIFLPLFLQELHGRSPLEAGYIAAVMSAGWTAGAILTAGFEGHRQTIVMRVGPVLSLASMLALAVLIPVQDGVGDWMVLVVVGFLLIVGGMGVGLVYPHLAAHVLRVAPADEADNAASSVMTVQLCATAFGAALAGLTVNLAGNIPGSQELDVANAARWLFAVVAFAPLLCAVLQRRESNMH